MSRHILIIGGHGRIAQILTQQLLKKSWSVTSLIRSQDQVSQINSLATANQGNLNVLVRNLEHVHDTSQARSILDEVKPDTVVWCAGAGGEARPDRTFAIDRDAAINFIKATAQTPTIKQLLLISYINCRRERPSWWDEDAWRYAQEMQGGGLLSYYQAKLAADEILLQEASSRADFSGISLRLGILSDEPAGPIELGKTTTSRGNVSRASVAEVIVMLLEHKAVQTSWLDMLDGAEDIKTAVERVVNDRENAAEEEGK
ncbi:uncharacterized protein B0J16DRAFT_276994 [Fusarium flagelliforme]|jgi:nucleoside-diphosphate-sugar epimerase|uniref:NAD(P)-binding domain-containing protein n=1 Tax=Fusarium flagelliforme TaxID=2675880 RepID=A0A395MH86_9HYPO|nr:uncharacterized protein B0J16DRAFT_276994 [Fusarium flagelliforme]KAH7169843.1 hypothetical protein B0J16DRAFT_276994 [Fusarium flagelliforme]RFN46623.1 hypothetical protein FIE12Z_9130 [Fusarium flagelliforme]